MSMATNVFASLSRLSNEHLVAEVKRLVAREREATATLIAHLSEMEARGLYLAEGCASLFVYCTRILHLSEHAAYGRINAARLVRSFPVLLDMLASGDVNLTAVTLLGRALTSENHRALLEEARHKSRRQIETIVARVRPRLCVAASVRKLPKQGHPQPTGVSPTPRTSVSGASCASAEPGPAPGDGPLTRAQREELAARSAAAAALHDARAGAGPAGPPTSAGAGAAASPPSVSPRPPRPAVVEPLSPDRYRIQFTASAETHEKLRRAQELLRHQIPEGDLAAVVDRALVALLREIENKKFGAAAKAAVGRGNNHRSRYIPRDVRRAVSARDGERCTFVGRDGVRCNERGFLEFDHRRPHADGGPATVENLRLLCRSHNQHTADLHFGPRPP